MLLAIDVGNTNIVFALYEGEEQRGVWRSSSDAKRTADEYAVWLSQLMSLRGLAASDVDAAIVATVVPEALFSLRTLCKRYFDCDPLVIGEPEVELGIGVLVDSPSEVGTDRLVNAVGAHERFGGPLIVIDFGTATTFDVVDHEGSYVGGVIAPGINLSLDALHAAAGVEAAAELVLRHRVALFGAFQQARRQLRGERGHAEHHRKANGHCNGPQPILKLGGVSWQVVRRR